MEKGLYKLLCLVLGLVFCFAATYELLKPRTGMVREFYRQDRNTIDVLFLGSSNSYSNINPAILWKESGITAYMLCGSGQPIWNSYYYLKEAYKTQTPKVVVLDVLSMASYPNGYEPLSSATGNTLSLKPSKNKLDNIMASVSKENLGSFLAGLPVFHNRWSEILEKGLTAFSVEMCNGAMEKGFYPVFLYEGREKQVYPDAYEIPAEKNVDYLQRIMDLCSEHGSKLLLIKTPYSLGEYHEGIYHWVSQFSAEHGVTFINYNWISEEFDFDNTSDMGDEVHLNNVGVEKLSRFMAKQIKELFQIPDRRSDDRCQSWEDYYQLWRRTQFMAPAGHMGSAVTLPAPEHYVVATTHLLQYAVSLERNQYYIVSIQDADILKSVVVDLFGENYENIYQKRRLDTNSETPFVIIKTDDRLPETVWLRVLGNDEVDSIDAIQVHIWETD